MSSNASRLEIKNVLITESLDEHAFESLKSNGIVCDVKLGQSPDQLKQEIKNYDALFVRSATKVTADLIKAAPNLKVIGRAGVGVDNIDVEASSAQNVILVNAPNGNTVAAAELTCGMLISLARHVVPAAIKLKNGTWDRKSYMGVELKGKTLGIIGLGKIGKEVASRMQAFGMKTIGFDPIVSKSEAEKCKIESMSLENLYPQADFITLHVPLIKQTRNMINLDVFNKCKKGVFIVNCARGGIINEEDAMVALDSGLRSGLATDVYEEEPPKNRKLVEHPKVHCTPHLGASTKEAQDRVAVEVAEQLIALTLGQEVWGCVNPANLPEWAKLK